MLEMSYQACICVLASSSVPQFMDIMLLSISKLVSVTVLPELHSLTWKQSTWKRADTPQDICHYTGNCETAITDFPVGKEPCSLSCGQDHVDQGYRLS